MWNIKSSIFHIDIPAIFRSLSFGKLSVVALSVQLYRFRILIVPIGATVDDRSSLIGNLDCMYVHPCIHLASADDVTHSFLATSALVPGIV